MNEEQKIPSWQRLGIVVLVLLNVAWVIFDWPEFKADFVPLDG